MPTLTLKPRHALPLFSHHPWVFATALKKGADGSDLMPGMEVVVESDKGEAVARGLVNPHSLIRVRLYSWTPDEPIGSDLLADRIRKAIALRRAVLGNIASCRLVFSEADGISGLTVDSYDGYLLVQLGSAALAPRIEALLDALEAELLPPGIWLRTDREIADKERMDPIDRLARGSSPPRPLVITENADAVEGGVQFSVDLLGGQKTGFYYDQRENRAAVAALARDKTVFDGHCYTGGYAITLARAGAKSVLAVDSSESAIQMARLNAEANDVHRTVTFEQADVRDRLAELAADGRRFDLVILDPPKLARSRKGLNRAIKAYVRLNAAALAVLPPGGLLVTHSCSGLVRDDAFDQMLQRVALESGREIRILERRGAARDHAGSVYCPETDYLTCRICYVEGAADERPSDPEPASDVVDAAADAARPADGVTGAGPAAAVGDGVIPDDSASHPAAAD